MERLPRLRPPTSVEVRRRVACWFAARRPWTIHVLSPHSASSSKRSSAGQAWDLGHDDYDRSLYVGPEHRHSRDPEGGNRATTGRRNSRGYPLIWSRKWDDDPPPGTQLHLGDGLVGVYLGHGVVWETTLRAD